MRFTATPGTKITILAIVNLAFWIGFFTWQLSVSNLERHPAFLWVMAALMLAGIVSSAVYYVLNYEVTNDALVVRKLFSKYTLKKISIRNVEILPKGALGFSWMIPGTGNVLALNGDYTNRRIGQTTWFRTRTDKIVMITTSSSRKIIVSPDEPERFVAELQRN